MNYLELEAKDYENEGLKRYREEFHQVDGWGIDDFLFGLFAQIDFFQKDWNIFGSCLEIGVHHGKTFILMHLLARNSEFSVAIDLFEDEQHLNLDNSGSGNFAIFMENVKKFSSNFTSIKILKGNTLHINRDDILKRTNAQPIRMVHVDGGHFKEIVANDLELSQSLICDGGVIIVDDYWHSGFPGVQEGVNRFFNFATSTKIIPFLTGNNKLFLTTHGYHAKYLEAMESVLPMERQKRITQFGYDSLCLDKH